MPKRVYPKGCDQRGVAKRVWPQGCDHKGVATRVWPQGCDHKGVTTRVCMWPQLQGCDQRGLGSDQKGVTKRVWPKGSDQKDVTKRVWPKRVWPKGSDQKGVITILVTRQPNNQSLKSLNPKTEIAAARVSFKQTSKPRIDCQTNQNLYFHFISFYYTIPNTSSTYLSQYWTSTGGLVACEMT